MINQPRVVPDADREALLREHGHNPDLPAAYGRKGRTGQKTFRTPEGPERVHVCQIDGVWIDGHLFEDGTCTVCGEPEEPAEPTA